MVLVFQFLEPAPQKFELVLRFLHLLELVLLLSLPLEWVLRFLLLLELVLQKFELVLLPLAVLLLAPLE